MHDMAWRTPVAFFQPINCSCVLSRSPFGEGATSPPVCRVRLTIFATAVEHVSFDVRLGAAPAPAVPRIASEG